MKRDLSSAKEKMQKLLNSTISNQDSMEDIILYYLAVNTKEFSATRVQKLINSINEQILMPKIIKLENIQHISKEKATYLKCYLEGDMYTTKEAAEQHLPVQIRNAEAIIDACKKDEVDYIMEMDM